MLVRSQPSAPFRGRRPKDRASAFQAEDDGFESRRPLQFSFLAIPIGREARLLISSFEVRILGQEPIRGCRLAARIPVSKTGNAGASPAALAIATQAKWRGARLQPGTRRSIRPRGSMLDGGVSSVAERRTVNAETRVRSPTSPQRPRSSDGRAPPL